MAFPPPTLSTAETLLSEAVRNAAYSESLRQWYKVSFPLKDRSLFEFEGKEVQTVGDPKGPPWEALILWMHIDGGYVAARGWTRGPERHPKIWKAARVQTVGEALDVWAGSPVVPKMADKLRLLVPDPDV